VEIHYFDCQCSDFGHVFRFVFDEQDGDTWLEVQLDQRFPWYKRVWQALKYVFGRTSRYGHFDTTMLREEDFHRLHDLLDRAALLKRQERLKIVPGLAQEKPLLKG
jgi:hypothetical protein